MAHSGRRSASATRRAFSGEHRQAAARGVPRGCGHLGFDTSDLAQQRLRALLALGIFNGGPLQEWPGMWAMASVTHYDLILSPRPDDLVVITPTPSNVLTYLVPRGKPVGLPGLRLEEARADAFQLRHLVTGARMTVTDRPPVPPFDGGFDEHRVWTVDQGLTGEEHDALADVPPMTDDTLVLLSGLVTRIGLRDPQRQWALGNWFMDPLDRTSAWGGRVGRRLWGRGDWWELTWGSFPFAEDVAMALTDPQAGIAGAHAVRVRRGWEVQVGTAVLALRVEEG
ncbi:hypothetical protein SM007_27510 [Streptomyces avermitilis]|uniref:Uncharacterized protein n=2 Tax=Streptomyces avermitilis TaxID=33903 RepID=Q82YA8_STRAW|nr:hypothetical protein SM007_27510 [Streptomyces avermitilis]BAC75357.1 conserved hypothetical protein [Streptomyces avermitilis MA-4680 = NBRC 14893]